MLSGKLIGGEGRVWTEPSEWTLLNEWSNSEGDLGGVWDYPTEPIGGIWGEHGGSAAYRVRGDTFSWSPDGTIFVVSSASADKIISYSAATPFDPDTLTATNSQIFVSGPYAHTFIYPGTSYISVNAGIKRYATDVAYRQPTTLVEGNYIDALDTGQVPTDGSPDYATVNFPIIDKTANRLLTYGRETHTADMVLYNWNVSAGDLENATYTNSVTAEPPMSVPIDIAHSTQLSWHGRKAYFYTIDASYNAYLVTVTFNSDDELSSCTYSTALYLPSEVTLGAGSWSTFSTIWINPTDPRYVWIAGRTGETYGMCIAKFSTGM